MIKHSTVSFQQPFLSLAVLLLMGVVAAHANPPPGLSYRIVPLEIHGSGSSRAMAINDAGVAVGWREDTNGVRQACHWQHFLGSNLVPLTGYHSGEAADINNAGWITGRFISTNDPGDYRGFIYKGGAYSNLPTLGGAWSRGYALNEKGTVAGAARPASRVHDAAVWIGTHVIDLMTFNSGGNYSSEAWGINDFDQVVGISHMWSPNGHWRPFVWQDLNTNRAYDYPDEMVMLGTLGGNHGKANDINNRGQIIGHVETGTSGVYHAFLITPSNGVWKAPDSNISRENDLMEDLGTLPGLLYAEPLAINDAGIAVGTCKTNSAGIPSRAFISFGERLTDLHTLIDTNAGWTLIQASDINNSGWIAGYGTYSNRERAFLMIPETNLLWFTEITGQPFLATNRLGIGWTSFMQTNSRYVLQFSQDLCAPSWTTWPITSFWPRYTTWWEGDFEAYVTNPAYRVLTEPIEL